MAQPGSFVMFYDRLIKDFDEKASEVFGRRGAPKRFRHIRQTWVNQKRRYEIEEKLVKDGLELPVNEDFTPTPAQLQAVNTKENPSGDEIIII